MSKFKTRGGKTVVYDSEAIGIDDPLLGSGMALGGRKFKKEDKRKAKRRERRDAMLKKKQGSWAEYRD